jgi:hypothetical protein
MLEEGLFHEFQEERVLRRVPALSVVDLAIHRIDMISACMAKMINWSFTTNFTTNGLKNERLY